MKILVVCLFAMSLGMSAFAQDQAKSGAHTVNPKPQEKHDENTAKQAAKKAEQEAKKATKKP